MPKLNTKTKWPAVVFALSNQNDIEQLIENAKNQNTFKATQTWLKVWKKWATERIVYEKPARIARLKRGHFIVEKINKKSRELPREFRDLWSRFQLVHFEKFQNTTRAHKS